MKRAAKITAAVAAGIVLFAVGGFTGSAASTPKTVTVTRTVAGPAVVEHDPGATVTVTASPPPPAAGTVIRTFSGSGNEVTPKFSVPADGSFTVAWSYYGNSDSYGPSNFSVTDNGGGFGDLPNDIAASGSGSTQVNNASAADSLNVQAAGHWTLTLRAA
jgi:hypothetical protein